MSDDFGQDGEQSEEETSTSGTSKGKRKYQQGSGKEAPPKRARTEVTDVDGSEDDEDSEDKERSSEEEYRGQPTGTYSPSGSSDESDSSQGTTADLASYGRFIRVVVTWARANQDRVDAICDTPGGWESWLEVELYLALRAAGVEVTRQPPFTVDTTGGSRADLYVDNRFLIEMKVETGREKASSFVRRLVTDLNKVDSRAGDRPAAVVGFSWSEQSRIACTQQLGAPIRVGVLSIFQDASLAG